MCGKSLRVHVPATRRPAGADAVLFVDGACGRVRQQLEERVVKVSVPVGDEPGKALTRPNAVRVAPALAGTVGRPEDPQPLSMMTSSSTT